MSLKRRIFAIHSYTGLISGILLLLVSLSGLFLVFNREIDRIMLNHLHIVEPEEEPVSLDTIANKVKMQFPEADYMRFRTLPSRPDESVEISVEYDEDKFPDLWHFAYYNPYTGEFLGKVNEGGMDNPSGWLLYFHYSLFMGKAGMLLVALLSLALMVSIVTGFLVYRKYILKVLTFQISVDFQNWRKASSGLHRVLGVWALLFNLVIAVSGFWMLRDVFTYDFYTNEEKPFIHEKVNLSASFDYFKYEAEKAAPGMQVVSIHPPGLSKDPLIVYLKDPSRPLYASENRVEFDTKTNKVIKTWLADEASLGETSEMVLYSLHFGQYGGMPLKIVYGIFAALTCTLTITGFMLWWRRKSKRKHQTTVSGKKFSSTVKA